MRLDPNETKLRRLLLNYWKSYPNGCDTVEGIQRWWLPDEHFASLARIETALDWLVEKNLVETLPTGTQSLFYRKRADATTEYMAQIDSKLTGDVDSGDK